MKHLNHLLRMFTVLAMLFLFALPTFAAENLNVYPTESTGSTYRLPVQLSLEVAAPVVLAESTADESVPTHTISDDALSFIISFEGFCAEPYWDVSRYSIGHGNSYEAAKALFGEDCAPITEEQAYELLKSEIVATETYMNRFFVNNGIVLNQNQYDALLSFTYNVGIGWTTYKNGDGGWCMLRTMLEEGPEAWTEERVSSAFGSWVMAGGQILPGLVQRRAAEAALFLTPVSDTEDSMPEDSNEPEDTEAPEESIQISFSDVTEGRWYHPAVTAVCQSGLMRGMGDGTFRPQGALTRAQLVQLLVNLENVTELDATADTGFSDVAPGSWYTGAIAWALEQGYVTGLNDGTFRPNEPVTREQMCTILTRYLRDKGYDVAGALPTFLDQDEIGNYAKESVAFCTAIGLIQGMGDGTFSPKSETTRAQAATVLLRMVDLG